MVSMDFTSARLVPAPGADGWLCRLPSAVVWLPAGNLDAGELISTFLSTVSPSQLLGSVGARLADPAAAPWPPFAIVAARGADLVVVVHGPVEVMVTQDGTETRLYGGDEAGSWLNRLLRGASVLRSGKSAADEGLVDLREGVIRAGGFALGADRELRASPPSVSPGPPVSAGPRVSAGPASPGPASAGGGGPARPAPAEADNPTVMDQPALGYDALGYDATVAEVGGGVPGSSAGNVANRGGGTADVGQDPADNASRWGSAPVQPAVLGGLTWDNGEVDQLRGAVLVGRDVASDEAVLVGQLAALVPSGQNDSMSRVHAELRPRGSDLVVIDRGSTNGTFVWDEASRAWQRLVAGQPQAVPAGTVLAFGERTATFESAPAGR